jgi:[FeFe] hydrogenase H-cluster maturation GTPase HydF
MQKTPKALRLHIGIFGRRNVGKSSVLNALIGQKVSIVSDVAGTTTDPVEKVMELQPAGPVVFIDTAGIDDVGALGQMRVAQTRKVIERTELAIIVTDDFQKYEKELLALFQERSTPVIIVANKSDLRDDDSLELQAKADGADRIVTTNASTAEGIKELRDAIIDSAKASAVHSETLVSGLVKEGDVVLLVTPIDIESPKGRMLLAQVQTLREVLDEDACAIVVKQNRVAEMIAALKDPPDLVITDSQVFESMKKIVPKQIPLTSFSILYAHYKGDLAEMVKGARSIEKIVPGDRILIAEACTHHPIGEDIGRVKIPKWLQTYAGGELHFDTVAGRDFPDDLTKYKLIIQCGSCVWNKQQVLSRIDMAKKAKVPITNYGLAIAFSLGAFERALLPFKEDLEI